MLRKRSRKQLGRPRSMMRRLTVLLELVILSGSSGRGVRREARFGLLANAGRAPHSMDATAKGGSTGAERERGLHFRL